MNNYKYDYTTMLVSIALLALLVIMTIAVPDVMVNGLVSVRDFIIYNLGSFFIVFVAALLVYNIWLAPNTESSGWVK